MRWLLSLLLSVAVVLLLFQLMQLFIASSEQSLMSEPAVPVSIVDQQEIEQLDNRSEAAPAPEPEIKPLDIPDTVTALELPEIDVNIDMQPVATVDTAAIERSQQLWTQPNAMANTVAANGEGEQQYAGQSATTKREITPLSTRRPNIPKVAFDNKIDGWVLLAFTVNPDGKVSDIQIMDAYPRGVFEANAVEAVKSWRYSPREKKRKKDPEPKPIRLSQKMDFQWSMYSYNMDY
jgi:TonB family protein